MPSSEVQQLSERVFYLPGGVNCVIVEAEDSRALLIDTGQDKDYGRRLRQACESLGLTPAAVLNSHAHADHFGGNDYLLRQYELEVYAPAFEAAILENPYLEPVYLMSGAKPLAELTSKWLLAKPSRVDHLASAGALELCGVRLELLDTSGHAHRQLSVLVDGVLVAADALFGEAVLARYPLPFGQDIGGQIASAASLGAVSARVVLPGHGDPSRDLPGLVEANLAAFRRAEGAVLSACNDRTTEEVLAECCQRLGAELSDLPRYYLNFCVVSAYLSHLREQGRVEARLEQNALRWTALS